MDRSSLSPHRVLGETGEVISDNADGIACWFIDNDYNEQSFFVRHAYFLGASLNRSTTRSRPFAPTHRRRL